MRERHRPPIFCMGPNKTGTTSLHVLFERSGIASATMGGFRRSRNLAQIMLRNASAARPILHGLEAFDAFSDINWQTDRYNIDIAAFVPQIVRQHPDAYFIYNDRPVEKWVKSRAEHYGGSFMRRFVKCYHVSEDEAKDIWRAYHAQHRENVETEVSAVGGKYLHFRLGDTDPEAIKSFLAPDYSVDLDHWGTFNQKRNSWTLRARLARAKALFVY